jgi:hypothetical protein
MSKEQLELLLKYIDLRVQRVADLPEGINFAYSDEEVDIRQELRNTIPHCHNFNAI